MKATWIKSMAWVMGLVLTAATLAGCAAQDTVSSSPKPEDGNKAFVNSDMDYAN